MNTRRFFWLNVICCVISVPTVAQVADEPPYALALETHVPYSALRISETDLAAARTLEELHGQYPTDWIRAYRRVAITTRRSGRPVVSYGSDQRLTTDQRAELRLADAGAPVEVEISYLPENTLSDNPVRTLAFTLAVDPATPAAPPGGPAAVQAYLFQRVGASQLRGVIPRHQLAAVAFTVDRTGQPTDPKLLAPSTDAAVDEQLIEAVCDMPSWQPARHRNGLPVAQTVVLAVGDLASCTRNVVGLPPPEVQ